MDILGLRHKDKNDEGYLDGQIIVAMPAMDDERFVKSVIYICAHSADGAMGIILNHPASHIGFKELLIQLEIMPEGERIALPPKAELVPVVKGGPVETGRGFVLHTSDYIIDETVTFLRYHISHATACTALDNFRDLETAGLLICHSIDKDLRRRAEELFRQYHDQKFSFTDCTSFALCQQRGLHHVVTVDSDFRILGFLLVPYDVSLQES